MNPGEVILGEYEVLARLGEGAMGEANHRHKRGFVVEWE